MTSAETLTSRLGGHWHGAYGTARCPVHQDRRPSLTIRQGEQSVLVKCHTGCNPKHIVDELRRRRLWPDRSKPKYQTAKRSAEDTRAYLLSIWREARAIAATPAERYLRTRGIKGELPPSLRYHPSLNHGPTGLLLPAMVAAVQAPDRAILGLHRTFLRADGADKAPVSDPRMMLGSVARGAVRLAAAATALALGEGIETCLSFQEDEEIPTWAALSAGGLYTVVLPPLPLAATVYLLVDLDTAGNEATAAAARRFSREGRRVKLVRPICGNDLNDALREARDAH